LYVDIIINNNFVDYNLFTEKEYEYGCMQITKSGGMMGMKRPADPGPAMMT
jgi:hypothetical protein